MTDSEVFLGPFSQLENCQSMYQSTFDLENSLLLVLMLNYRDGLVDQIVHLPPGDLKISKAIVKATIY